MSKPILTVPHDTLRRKSVAIVSCTSEVQLKVQELKEAMLAAHNPEGVGLSFPQIGYNLRGFVTYLDNRMKVYLNPTLLDMSEERSLGGSKDRPTLEGCLSIPWLYGPVWRSKRIKVQAIDEHGVEFTKILTSFPARLFLHEYDHLEGILFTDHTKTDSLPLYLLDRQSDKFVQLEDPSSVIKW
jgi:peptide deformylase